MEISVHCIIRTVAVAAAAAVGALLHDTPVAGLAGGPIGSDKAIFIKPSSAWACCNVG